MKKKSPLKAAARLAGEIKQYKKDVLMTPVFMTLCVILEIYIPYLTASIIDDGIAVGNMAHVMKIGALMIVMAALAALFGIMAGQHSARASTGFACNVRETMFDKIQSYSFRNIDKFSTAGLVTRMTTDVGSVQMALQMMMMMCVRAPMTMLVALFMAFSISPKLSTIFLAVMVVLICLLVLLVPMAMKYFKAMFKKYDALNAVIKENIGSIRVVKAFVREKHENEKFAKAAGDVYSNSVAAEKIMSLNNPIMMTCVRTCTLLISWFGAQMIVSGTGLTTGELTSLLSYVMNILFSLMMLSMVYVMITQSAAAAERIDEVLCETPDIVSPENAVQHVADGSIEFDHVAFSYHGKDGKRVLENISLRIESGETIGVIGGTGSSKSTLVSLISRLYDATEGSVKVGGVDVR
ncbi:MAG: ABC transporter ATP-binding protein, partial [Clostridia bacterium]|nr:ABC transporter ATP-binding protein [Clostridia bacterium]